MMGKEIKVIRMGRAMGKTTKALELLQAQGGGVFFTRNPMEAHRIIKQHALDKVTVVSYGSGYEHLVIDDADMREITLVTNTPLELRET